MNEVEITPQKPPGAILEEADVVQRPDPQVVEKTVQLKAGGGRARVDEEPVDVVRGDDEERPAQDGSGHGDLRDGTRPAQANHPTGMVRLRGAEPAGGLGR
jgi:hypothetical protein